MTPPKSCRASSHDAGVWRHRKGPLGKYWLLLVGAAALLDSLPGHAAPGSDAPLGVGTQGSFESLFLEVILSDGRRRLRPELELGWTLANDWSIPTSVTRGNQTVRFQTDEQTDSLSVSWWMPWAWVLGAGPSMGEAGLWERLSSNFELQVTEHWGGWSDRPIEWWHQLIGSNTFERPLYPLNQVNLSLVDVNTGQGVNIRSARFALGDLVLRTQFLIAEGGNSAVTAGRSRWGLSVRFDLKAPTGSPERLGGSGGWDAGLAFLGTVELASWVTLHAMVAVSAFSALALPVPLQPRPWHYTVEFSLPFRVGTGHSSVGRPTDFDAVSGRLEPPAENKRRRLVGLWLLRGLPSTEPN